MSAPADSLKMTSVDAPIDTYAAVLRSFIPPHILEQVLAPTPAKRVVQMAPVRVALPPVTSCYTPAYLMRDNVRLARLERDRDIWIQNLATVKWLDTITPNFIFVPPSDISFSINSKYIRVAYSARDLNLEVHVVLYYRAQVANDELTGASLLFDLDNHTLLADFKGHLILFTPDRSMTRFSSHEPRLPMIII